VFSLKKLTATLALISAGSALTNPVIAASYEFDDYSIEWDTVVTAGMQFRIEDRNERISQGSTGGAGQIPLYTLPNIIDNAFIINSNDGNNNFDKGLTSQRLSLLTEADINFGDSGFFMRAKFWQDHMYNKQTDMDEIAWATNNANPVFGPNGGYATSFGEHNPAARNYARQGYRLLDAFAYTSFLLPNDQEITLRIGQQVISWGEALLSGGGLATGINHVDAHIRNQPGLELKELFLPSNAIMLQTQLSDTVSLEAYYQLEWNPAFIDPSGTFMSEFDSIGDGGEQFIYVSGLEEQILGIGLQDHLINRDLDAFDINNWCNPDFDNPNSPNANVGSRCGDADAAREMIKLAQFLPNNCKNEGTYDYFNQRKPGEAGYDAAMLPEKAGANPNAVCRILAPHKVAEYKARNSGQFGFAFTL